MAAADYFSKSLLLRTTLICATLTFILLFEVPTTLACAALPYGQERILYFDLTGFSIAAQMAYTTSASAQSKVPMMSKTQMEAQNVINNYIRDRIHSEIRRRAAADGLSLAAQNEITNQIGLLSSYHPIQCSTVFLNINTTQGVDYVAGPGYNCFVDNGTVSGVCKGGGCTPNQAPVPTEFINYRGILEISNVVIAGWSKYKWQQILNQVTQLLASGELGKDFTSSTITVL
uniref:SCP domain-containing protein n=1 Tax=Haemonchus contortus TaxID=6289 RepID=A0A7I4Y3N4_HAECO